MLQTENIELILSDLGGRLFETHHSNIKIESSNNLAFSFLRYEFHVITNAIQNLEEQCKCDFFEFGMYQEKTLRILIRLINRLKILRPLLEQKKIRSKINFGNQDHSKDIGIELLKGEYGMRGITDKQVMK